MRRAAGVMVVVNGRALFLKRAPGTDHPGQWCFPGGNVEDGETAEDAARREFKEETGHDLKGPLIPWTCTVSPLAPATPPPAPVAKADAGLPDSPAVAAVVSAIARGAGAGLTAQSAPPVAPEPIEYVTFIARGMKDFDPAINDEHVGHAWAPPGDPPLPLHEGCRVAIARIDMDEVGVARAVAAGELTSPQPYENLWLFDLRITGTGRAFRHKLDEHVYRPPEHYLTAEFLARCNGLPVIWEHPKRAMMTSKDFRDRVVGTIMLPYVKGDEVWGVAKILDQGAAELMRTEQLSTSPDVVFRNPTVNNKVELEDGSTLLIEGKPSLLDHLAICEVGVWDKGEGPTGVRTEARGDENMTDKVAEAAKQVREDARADDAGGKARTDAARKDEPSERAEMAEKIKAKEGEAEKKKDDDEGKRADADAGKKLDQILGHLDGFGKRLDSVDRRLDAAEEKMNGYGDRRKDAAGEDEKDKPERTAADKGKKDADEKGEKAEDKKDSERKDARADDAAVAGTGYAAFEQRLKDLEARSAPVSDDLRLKFADSQARADSVFQQFGKFAPRPLDGESLLAYRRRLAHALQPFSDRWKDVNLVALADEAAFGIMEGQVYADAAHAANHPTDLKPGQLREIVRVDPSTGTRMITFVGGQTFIAGLKRPPRYVSKINHQRDRA